VSDSPAALPVRDEAPAPVLTDTRPGMSRWFAMLQAFLVCGIPTGAVITIALWFGAGIEPYLNGQVRLEFFAMVSLLDTALIAMLIYVFLQMSGETSNEVFFGRRSIRKEIWLGLKLVPAVFLAVVTVVLALRTVFPSLHNVRTSPLESFLGNPTDAAIFLVVVVLAGGIREELQRGFILHRFDKYLGGVKLGLVIFSMTFGLLHVDQGFDVAIAIGLLGLLWGIIYVTRRSVVAPMVNHAAFNAAQVLQAVAIKSMGL
jgi:membrane protease YdiL (CAAX protease family)